MLFKTELIGHLGGDAVVRDVNGKKCISFSVAHSEKWRGQDGVQHSKTIWVRCAYWRDADRDAVAQYLKSGTLVFVEGDISANAYTKDGEIYASLDLRVLTLKLLASQKNAVAQYVPAAKPAQPNPPPQAQPAAVEEDDLPF